MSEELKPCPFCGGDAYIAEKPYHGNYNRYAICKSCEAETSCYKSDSLAIEAWNTRTTDAEILALRQEVSNTTQAFRDAVSEINGYRDRAETAEAKVRELEAERKESENWGLLDSYNVVKSKLNTAEAEVAQSANYLEQLLVGIHAKHYNNQPDSWKPLGGDIIGMLTQLDNMLGGWTKTEAEVARLREMVNEAKLCLTGILNQPERANLYAPQGLKRIDAIANHSVEGKETE